MILFPSSLQFILLKAYVSYTLFSLYNPAIRWTWTYKSQYEIAFFGQTEGEKETIVAFISFYLYQKILCNEVSKSKWASSNKDCTEKPEDKTDEKHILLLGDFHSWMLSL